MGNTLFADMPPFPSEHFKLYFYAAVLHIIEQTSHAFNSYEKTHEQFPFLIDYNNELARHGLEGLSRENAYERWRDALFAWEERVDVHLPIRALRKEAGLDYEALTLLMSIGVIEDEPRFGQLFDEMQGGIGQRRPTVGLLTAWWSDALADEDVRLVIRRVLELGLVKIVNPDAPRAESALQIPGIIWDALRGDVHDAPAPWVSYQPSAKLVSCSELVVPETLMKTIVALPALIRSEDVRTMIIRGPRNNGRRTLLGAVARSLELGLLIINGLSSKEDERWSLLGPLATLLHAMPAIVFDPGPGETVEAPSLKGYSGPLGIVIGRQGGVNGPGTERSLILNLEMPGIAERQKHWTAALESHDVSGMDTICERFRMSSGNIRRTAQLARAYAALEGYSQITPAAVQQASRSFNRQALDTLAVRIESSGDWSHLAVGAETFSELYSLEQRCRYREQLSNYVNKIPGGTMNPGVRALFSGPSGTGKTFFPPGAQ